MEPIAQILEGFPVRAASASRRWMSWSRSSAVAASSAIIASFCCSSSFPRSYVASVLSDQLDILTPALRRVLSDARAGCLVWI